MKKIFVSMLLLLTISSLGFGNKGDGMNSKVTNSFKKDFAHASELKWENGKAFVKITFRLNEEIMFAYYSQNGDLMAVSRNILSSNLPLAQLIKLKSNYTHYWISDLFEIDADLETSYYITLEDAESRLILKSDPTNGWEVYKKETKM
jgi:hypothetical protein